MATEEGIEITTGAAKPSERIEGMANQIHVQSGKQDLEDVELADDEEEQGQCADRTLTTRIAQGVAGASIVINIVAIAIEQSAVMILAGIIALVIGPIVIMQQFKIQDTGGKLR